MTVVCKSPDFIDKELTAPKPCDDDEPFRSLKQILVDQGKSNHPNIIQNSRM